MVNQSVERGRERQKLIAANRAQRNTQRQEMMSSRRDIANNAYLTRMQGRNAQQAGADPRMVQGAQQQAMLYGDTIGGYQDRRQGYLNQGTQREFMQMQGQAELTKARSPEAVAGIESGAARHLGGMDYALGMQKEATAMRGQNLGARGQNLEARGQNIDYMTNLDAMKFQQAEGAANRQSAERVAQYDMLGNVMKPTQPMRPITLGMNDLAVDPSTGQVLSDPNERYRESMWGNFTLEHPELFDGDTDEASIKKEFAKYMEKDRKASQK